MTAFKYYYIPLGPVGLGGIVIEPTPNLLRLQQELIDAVGPYTVKTAAAAAFYTIPAEPDINPAVIDYIAAFSDHIGEKFSPACHHRPRHDGFSGCDAGRRSLSPRSPSGRHPPQYISSAITVRRARG